MLLQEFVFGEISIERFKAEFLDKQPLLIKGANRLYEHVNMESIDDLLNANEGNIHAFTRVLIGSEDQVIHANPLFFAETQKTFIDKQFQLGATIKVEDFEFRHPLMAKICRAYEAEFGGDTYAMTFLTPPKQQGFGIHFDPVSSFITQLSGRKHWKIYPEHTSFPTKTMNRPLAGVPMPDPLIETVIEPGDLLYIPAGFPHEAMCTDSHSLHMTVGVGTHRPVELLQYALQELLEQYVELRQPVYPTAPDFKNRITLARDVLANAVSEIDVDTLISNFKIAYSANRIDAQKYGLANYAKAYQLCPDSLVRCVPHKPSYIEVHGDKLWIRASSTIRPGRPLLTAPPHIELPAIAESEVRQLLTSTVPVTVRELHGELDLASKVVLARKFSNMGLIEVVDSSLVEH
ncbi:JmjC domain-containing protein [Iodobacter fluviatilis]|uniref:Cupin superfamily protein n=1 Tax=Iodobacter fluviatilis TaxID=537 RepID=A0A377SRW1_9NEIS|nr:cupin domain-containing protein [Iodobacter fluviatilis]TCU81628.1 cupin superfamily protein [Iodobacter fluviatilis]STR44772.1 Cupin superfamily protein [Iodobacter fluviatilis]